MRSSETRVSSAWRGNSIWRRKQRIKQAAWHLWHKRGGANTARSALSGGIVASGVAAAYQSVSMKRSVSAIKLARQQENV